MGAAFVRGLQRHVMGCAKHFACNSIENRRFEVDVRASEGVLDTVYLPHFKRVVDEGVASIMSAYNSLNGEWCGQNRSVITELLRGELGYKWLVMSDWWSVWDAEKIMKNGLDLEMPASMMRCCA